MISEKKLVTQEIFMLIIIRKWKAIDKDLYLKLAKSMSKQVELVIESQGCTINYWNFYNFFIMYWGMLY